MELILHVDGGSRGNPGPAGYGVFITDPQGRTLAKLKGALGSQTNNFAEYRGLIAALKYALEKKAANVTIIADSQLMVRQMQGHYQVKSESLRPLYLEAQRLAHALPRFRIEHVLRGNNKEADQLANDAMDEARKQGGKVLELRWESPAMSGAASVSGAPAESSPAAPHRAPAEASRVSPEPVTAAIQSALPGLAGGIPAKEPAPEVIEGVIERGQIRLPRALPWPDGTRITIRPRRS